MEKRLPIFVKVSLPLTLLLLSVSGCSLKRDVTPSEFRAGYECVEITQGLEYKVIEALLQDPDIAPRPGSESLSANMRAFTGRTVVFHTGLKKTEVGGRTVYREVVTGMEVCKCK